MTREELEKIPFHFVSHISFEDEHITTYASEDNRIGFSNHVPYKNGQPNRKKKAYRIYMVDGEIFDDYEEFLEALKSYSPNVIPLKQ